LSRKVIPPSFIRYLWVILCDNALHLSFFIIVSSALLTVW
jgi:hypothetical protein